MAPVLQNELEQLLATLWQELAGAVAQPGHAWRTAVLATRQGDEADARTIILREVDVVRRELLFFTDSRSPKATQIEQAPQGVLVLWSPALSWQLRLRVQLQVASSGLAVSSRWARLKLKPAAADYLSPLPPGSRLDSPQQPPSPPAIDRDSRSHFAVVTATVTGMDWLELKAEGHRRALFDAAGGRWVTP
jgi:pyridoxamine 5'-phosphate oxidase